MGKKEEYLLHENPRKALVLMTLPIVVGSVVQQLYTMVDSMVVGRYVSAEALAAVGASYFFTNFFIWFAFGAGLGAGVVVSRYFGARDYRRLKTAAYTGILTFLFVSILLGIFGFFFGRPIMHFLNTPDDVIDLAASYLRIYFLGLPFLFLYNMLSNLFYALGNSKIPLYFLIISSLLNVGLDFIAVCGLNMGVAGAALATVLAQGLSAVASLCVLRRQLKILCPEKVAVFSRAECGSILRISLPSIAQQTTISVGILAVQSVANRFGSQMLAGYAAAVRLDQLCVEIMASFSTSITSFTSQNLGAGNVDRVKKCYRSAMELIAAISVVICVVYSLFKRPLIGWFLGKNLTETALQTGVSFISFTAFFYCILGFKMLTDGLLRGGGTLIGSTVASFLNLAVRIALSFLLVGRVGMPIVWISMPIGWLVSFLISFTLYLRGGWKTKKI